jgi:ribA/ribD-fused uncharacterized protein
VDGTPRTVEQLVELVNTGRRRVKFVHFWGHRPAPDGSIGTGCLSQWWPAEFAVDGVTFRSAEHHMMWRKAKLFGDDDTAARIVAAGHPRQAKLLGRRVCGFDEQTWCDHRYDIVVGGSIAKFGQNPTLRDFLLSTDDHVLVEASPTDRIWGIGLAASDQRALDPAQWIGLNLLGFALMQARASLRPHSKVGV